MPSRSASLSRLRLYESARQRQAQTEADPQLRNELGKLNAVLSDAIREIESTFQEIPGKH